MKPTLIRPHLALLAVLALPALAHADVVHEEPPALRYAFDDELVGGEVVSPDVELLRSRRRGTRTSLVEVRVSYLPELLKSVEDL